MNKNLQTVFHYHETTKHSQQRYARSLGYMDWATQPNPFREYAGAKKIELPLCDAHTTPPYSLLDEELPSAPLVKESLSQFLQYSLGLAAWKVAGGDSWAVRCNASSGNLHPTESYVILPPLLGESSSIMHYAPKKHELEVLCEFESTLWEELPKGSFLVGLSSISWREVWKYGERAFRYVNLDAGHAWHSLVVSAKLLGWNITRLDSVSNIDMNSILGLTQESRFHEDEIADMILVVSPGSVNPKLSLEKLTEVLPLVYNGDANKLSPTMQEWEIIPAIEKATQENEVPQRSVVSPKIRRVASQESREVILKRRSIHVMDKESSTITQAEFFATLRSVTPSLDEKENSAHLVIFVNRVENTPSGLYILIRNDRDKEKLQELSNPAFLWKESELPNLYLLHEYDYKMFSKTISCAQDIASDGAYSLGMLVNFSQQLNAHGAHRYKELYWECGAIGQQLYLEATSMGLSGTGIGCFLDDMVHEILGLKDNQFQTLYHFTVGRGHVDSRIQTRPPYERNQ
ncbi:SagB/ThcOx family dehydrogenase [Sulfurimonas aquatica]|uniref:SagB/ThcOx family dehydrogenase n=1 Tax=Sulfurimonas aquatica TaxID=2672570 RepID=A0A975GC28_9BACT|nr:nitroreductase family protein [Sulfurimonas aquatica]QSZ40853.1 SagB/ThcOx family dehydrogenase [Sulfurimonas aquatica]